MFKEHIFIILVVNIHTSSCALDVIYETGKQVWQLHAIIDKMELNNFHDASTNKTFSDSRKIIQQMNTEIDQIDEQLKQIENFMHPKMIWETLKTWPVNAIIAKNIDTFEIFTSKIDDNYSQFQRYRKINEASNPEDYLDTEGDIATLREIITEGKNSPPGGLPFAITAFAIINREKICNSPQIISNILIQLFRMIIIAEMKTNIILNYVNVHLYIEGIERRIESQYRNTISKMLFEERLGIYMNTFLINFSLIDSTYWRACDPDTGSWIRDTSFYEMEQTFQTTIFRYRWYNCKYDSCNHVRIHKSYQCQPETYDYRSSCGGFITDCTYLSAIQACVLKNGPHRFQYVNSTALGHLGTNFECAKDNGYIIQDGTGWNSSYATCACNCLSTHNKISLSIIESNVKFNRVIVGLRFVRLDGILYIQPREAVLRANGYIHPNTQRWINIPRNTKSSLIHQIDRRNRVFFLDDLRLPPSFVLTGVKLNKVRRGTVTGYAIQIFGVHFDYKSGKLFLQEELRLSEQASNAIPVESLPFKAVSSIYTTLRHEVSPSKKKYVSLQQSRLEEDFGQSTLPLFDATPISIHLPSALSGIGIFHKGVEGYAGFISLRVYGIQYEKYFQELKFSHMSYNRVLFNDSGDH